MEDKVFSHRSVSVWHYANPVALVRNVWRHRQLILQLTRREVGMRYSATSLGMLWPILVPLFMLTIYTFVFGFVLEVRWDIVPQGENRVEFALILYCGLICYNVFSESLLSASHIVISNANYVKKVVFPLEILPVVSVCTALFQGFLSFIVLLTGILIFMKPSATIIYMPLILLTLCAFVLGLCWLVSALGVFLRDIGQIMMLLVQVLIFATPVFYPAERVPDQFRWILNLNPLTAIVNGARQTIIKNELPDWQLWGLVTLCSLIVLQIGYMAFMRSKGAFGDVL